MNLSLDQLPFNLFDILLLAVLAAGIVRGRRHGMSEELLNLLTWVSILAACTMLYEPGGRMLSDLTRFSLLSCYVTVYVAVALAILGLFGLLKVHFGGKLIGSDFFGRGEFYLGMGSGLARFACMLVAGLALLNAPYYTPAEVRAREKFQNDVYGSEYFPGLHNVQEVVFQKVFVRPFDPPVF